jgi:site-specific DNA-cytosine methylase
MGTNLTHASIIPLIGGLSIGTDQAFGKRSEFLMSYEPFWANDRHLVNYYENDVPYHVLDKGQRPDKRVDVVTSTCPCAGLSMMSQGYSADAAANDWMRKAAGYVLGELRPTCYFGENAPGLAQKIGKEVREDLYRIGRENGYSMSLYRTRTLLHGGPQVRERSFYFFWRGDRVPLFEYFDKPHDKIEDVILGVTSNFQHETINPKTPSEEPYYRFILEGIHGGRTHREHAALVEPSNARGCDTFSYIERKGYDYRQVADWMEKNGHPEEVEKCIRKYEKLKAGGSIMRRGVIVPKDRIGAFVGWYPHNLTHPVEDRFITYREAMTIMGLPSNFELLDPKKSTNHICQNVPVVTARDMATEVVEALEGRREWVDETYMVQYNTTRKLEFAPEAAKTDSLAELFD